MQALILAMLWPRDYTRHNLIVPDRLGSMCSLHRASIINQPGPINKAYIYSHTYEHKHTHTLTYAYKHFGYYFDPLDPISQFYNRFLMTADGWPFARLCSAHRRHFSLSLSLETGWRRRRRHRRRRRPRSTFDVSSTWPNGWRLARDIMCIL